MNVGLNIISWNVKGLNHPVKRKKVMTHLKQFNAGIAFLQETHLKNSDHSRLRTGWVGQLFHSSFESKSRGVAIAINKEVTFVHSNSFADINGRYLIVSGLLYNTKVVLVNIYAPNIDDPLFFERLIGHLPDLNSHSLIMGGDFNFCMNPIMDRSSSRFSVLSNSASLVQSFLTDYGASDIWRFLHPREKEYSFYSHVHHTYSRIDYLFIDNKLIQYVQSCDYKTILISDHAPLVLTVTLPQVGGARKHWRFNSLLLSDEDFVSFLSNQITMFLDINITPDISIITVWESLKAFMRGQIIAYAVNKKRVSRAAQDKLDRQIKQIDSRNAQSPSLDLDKERLKFKTEYDLLTSHYIENLLLKNRSTVYEHGDKAGEILARQLRGARAKQLISGIRSEEGAIITNQQEINDTFKEFYAKLYTAHNPNVNLIRNFFQNLNVPILSPEQILLLEKQITLEEVCAAVKSLRTGKSPGPDGFPNEFYQCFCKLLSPILTKVFIESFSSGHLPPTFNQSCITLLLKKNKDPLDCGSYRPISLLNSDYKILTKILSLRLEQVLPSIISSDQTGFVKQRPLFFNIRRLLNVLYSPCQSVSECLLSMDAEKAFDRVEWNFLFETMSKFGFGDSFISWMRLLYSSPSAMVLTNNTYSKPFNLYRGTKQGCPLSPLLFVLAIEPLAISIRSNGLIAGITRGITTHKLSLYADDLLLYVSKAESTIPHIIQLIHEFGEISGYKLNLQKSELMPLNLSSSVLECINVPFKIVKDGFTYLGITVTRVFSDLFDLNFGKLLAQTKQDLTIWSSLPISLTGRVNTISMMVLPRYLYLFQCLPIFIPGSYFKKLDSAITGFIWKGKQPRLRKDLLQKAKRDGGLALPNFKIYYWAANLYCIWFWVHYAFEEVSPVWVVMERDSCEPVSLLALVSSPMPMSLSNLSGDNPVVINSLKIYAQFRKHYKLLRICLFSPIAKNSFFQPSMQDTVFNIWYNKGIKCISDLFIQGEFASFEQLSQKYSLPASNFFRYLQVRHYVKDVISAFPHKPAGGLLEDIFTCELKKKGAVSLIIKNIQNVSSPSNSNIRQLWERDLQMTITEDMWANILKQIHSSSMCARHSLIQFKVVHRAHMSKSKLSKMFPQLDPTCDRCKIDEATLLHMFWTCNNLEGYWRGIFEALSTVLGVTIAPDPLTALFGLVPENMKLPSGGSKVVAFSTLLARRLILLKWKDSMPPSVTHWIREVVSNLRLERIRYTIRGSEQKFVKVWKPFLTFFDKSTTQVYP